MSISLKPSVNSQDNLDKDADGSPQNPYDDSNKSIFIKKSLDKKSIDPIITTIRSQIVDAYRSAFGYIWSNCYIRQSALNGDPKIFSMINQSFDCLVCESVISDISKLISVASSNIKQPILESISSNNTTSEECEQIISNANKFIDKLFYENINSFTGAFSTSLRTGISFLHIDLRSLQTEGVKIKEISPYRCMWDITMNANDISKGSFFLMEEFMSTNNIRDLFSNDRVEKALSQKASMIDTFPLVEMNNLILQNKNIISGSKFNISEKDYNFQYQVKDEISTGHSKLTTIYVRNKAQTIVDGNKSFRNTVEKLVYVNDHLIDFSKTDLEFIPIISFAPLEEISSNSIKERYKSLYDCIKSELLSLAILLSSVSTTVLNNANSPIFVRDDLIPPAMQNNKAIRNRIIPIKKLGAGVSISEVVNVVNNPGVPPGTSELILALKQTISQKLNILTNETAASKSAAQEQIRIDNQLLLSSSILETLDRSIMEFGNCMKDILKVLSLKFPEKIQETMNIDEEKIDLNKSRRMSFFLDVSRVVLEESHYFTTKSQKDVKKIQQIASITNQEIPIPLHVLMEAVGVSDDMVHKVREATNNKNKLEEEGIALENEHKKLKIEREKAEIQKILAQSYKEIAEAKKKEQEAKEIKNPKSEEDTGKKASTPKQIKK